jgi:hypothetical protein
MRFIIYVCAELVNKMRISQHYRIINVHIRTELSVICVCVCGVKLPEDDVKKIDETFRSTSELHVKVYILIPVLLLVLIFRSSSVSALSFLQLRCFRLCRTELNLVKCVTLLA